MALNIYSGGSGIVPVSGVEHGSSSNAMSPSGLATGNGIAQHFQQQGAAMVDSALGRLHDKHLHERLPVEPEADKNLASGT